MTQTYIEEATGRYPIGVPEIRARWNGLFGDDVPPEALADLGLAEVQPAAPPAYDPATQILVEDPPAKTGGVWRQVWKIRPIPVPPQDQVIAAIDAEKARRIEAGFPFKGKVIQSRAEDRENIMGARAAAQDAKLMNAQPGDYGWQRLIDPIGGAATFAWITLDNSLLPLDADDTIAMGYAAMFHKQKLIFDGKALKDRVLAGYDVGDVTRDELWAV